MRILTTLFFLSLAPFALASCETFPATTFTTENIMKVHQGMKSSEILAMFGKPKDVDIRVCGKSPNQWTCTTWKYDVFPDGHASFTFAGNHDSLVLNNFNVDRE